MKNYIISTIFFLLVSSLWAQEDVTYKVSIDATPLIKVLAGAELPGEAHVRLTVFGKDGSVVAGKLCHSIIPNISFEREYIGRITGVEISLKGSRWTKPVKINRVTIRVTGDNIDPKTFRSDVGYSLTTGNSTIYIDEGGAAEFEEDAAAVQADELAKLAKLLGDFRDGDVPNGQFTISKQSKPKKKQTVAGTRQSAKSPDGWECTTEKVSATQAFDENFISNPSGAAFYPGALVYAEDLTEGKYNTINFNRKPITLSTDLAIVNGDPMIKVDNPNLGNIRTAMNYMLVHQTKGDFQLKAQYEVVEVYSEQQLSIALGGHFAYGPGSLDLSFNYARQEEKSVIVAKFSQEYYQINLNQFQDPYKDVFVNTPDAEEVLNSGKTPLYVGSVKYGRIAYFTMTTSKTLEEVSATLNAAYNSGVVDASADLAVDMSELIQESKMHVMVIGGDGSQPFSAVDGFEGFKDMIRDGGTLSETSLAQPISYTLNFLSDNSVAYTNLATDFVKRTCKKKAKVVDTKVDYEFKFTELECVDETDDGANSEIGYSFKASLIDEHGRKWGAFIYESYGSESNSRYVLITDDGKHSLGNIKDVTLDSKVNDISRMKLVVEGTVEEYDDAPNNNEVMKGSKTFSLRDANGAGLIKWIDIRHSDGDHFKLHFSMKKIQKMPSQN